MLPGHEAPALRARENREARRELPGRRLSRGLPPRAGDWGPTLPPNKWALGPHEKSAHRSGTLSAQSPPRGEAWHTSPAGVPAAGRPWGGGAGAPLPLWPRPRRTAPPLGPARRSQSPRPPSQAWDRAPSRPGRLTLAARAPLANPAARPRLTWAQVAGGRTPCAPGRRGGAWGGADTQTSRDGPSRRVGPGACVRQWPPGPRAHREWRAPGYYNSQSAPHDGRPEAAGDGGRPGQKAL